MKTVVVEAPSASGSGGGAEASPKMSSEQVWARIREQHEPLVSSHVSYEDFLKADANGDGRVTAAEWESYVRSKRLEGSERFHGVTLELPVSPSDLFRLIDAKGFGVSL